MTNAERVSALLTEAKVFYLATIDGNQPKCRPLGFHMLRNDKIYFGVGTFKAVYLQMLENDHVELCACIGDKFLRYYGKVAFDPDPAMEESALEQMPQLRAIYNEQTGNKMGIFHLEQATAEIRNLLEVEETLSM